MNLQKVCNGKCVRRSCGHVALSLLFCHLPDKPSASRMPQLAVLSLSFLATFFISLPLAPTVIGDYYFLLPFMLSYEILFHFKLQTDILHKKTEVNDKNLGKNKTFKE